jgi:hypothetical protein
MDLAAQGYMTWVAADVPLPGMVEAAKRPCWYCDRALLIVGHVCDHDQGVELRRHIWSHTAAELAAACQGHKPAVCDCAPCTLRRIASRRWQ